MSRSCGFAVEVDIWTRACGFRKLNLDLSISDLANKTGSEHFEQRLADNGAERNYSVSQNQSLFGTLLVLP